MFAQETEGKDQMKLNEINYNCSECSSPIEILSIDAKNGNIEFNCVKNNHKRRMPIKEYLDKMKKYKKYNDQNINNDKCIHNNKYECFCSECKKHLCKECLKSRDHINHQKVNIIEIQPNKNELKIIEKIIEFYDDRAENLFTKKNVKRNIGVSEN